VSRNLCQHFLNCHNLCGDDDTSSLGKVDPQIVDEHRYTAQLNARVVHYRVMHHRRQAV